MNNNQNNNRLSLPIGILTERKSMYSDDVYYTGKLGMSSVVLQRTKKDPTKWLLKLVEEKQPENRGYDQNNSKPMPQQGYQNPPLQYQQQAVQRPSPSQQQQQQKPYPHPPSGPPMPQSDPQGPQGWDPQDPGDENLPF